MFEKADVYKIIRPGDERARHYHDTNCISEPTTSSCAVKIKKDTYAQEVTKTTIVKEAAVNTESRDLISDCKSVRNRNETNEPISDNFSAKDNFDNYEKVSKDSKNENDSQPIKYSNNYILDNVSSKTSNSKTTAGNKPLVNDFDSTRSSANNYVVDEKVGSSLLLDRNIGLTLDSSTAKISETKLEKVQPNSPPDLKSVLQSPERFLPLLDDISRYHLSEMYQIICDVGII